MICDVVHYFPLNNGGEKMFIISTIKGFMLGGWIEDMNMDLFDIRRYGI
jgi:hypothetical protein